MSAGGKLPWEARYDAPEDAESAIAGAIDAELEEHVQRLADDIEEQTGVDRRQAEDEARRRLSLLESSRAELARLDSARRAADRRAVAVGFFAGAARAAWRSIRRAPAASLGVAFVLALGLGANAVTFAWMDRLLLHGPMGLERPQELHWIFVHRAAGAAVAGRRPPSGAPTITTDYMALPDVVDLRSAQSLAGSAAITSSRVVLGRGRDAETATAMLAEGDFFRLLGVDTVVGRPFQSEDDRVGAPRVAVLAHGFWRRHFDADPDVLGTDIVLDGDAYSVIGVAPEGFTGPTVDRVDLFLPLRPAAGLVVSGDWEQGRNIVWLRGLVRLAPGATRAEAAAEATTLHRAGRADSRRYDPGAEVLLEPLVSLGGPGAQSELQVAALLAALSVLLLVVAVSNVANLGLAAAVRRTDERSIRMALGAGRAHLVLEESLRGLALAGVGVLAALALASAVTGPAGRLLLPQVEWLSAGRSGTVVLWVALLGLLAGLLAGVPSLFYAGRGAARPVHQQGRRSSASRSWLRTSLLVGQATLSMVLLVGAALFVRSFQRVSSLDLGLDPHGLVVVRLDGLPAGTEEVDRIVDTLRERLRRVPGVKAVSLGTSVPFMSSWSVELKVPGLEELPRVDDGGPYIYAVTPDYFGTLGMEIQRGRGIEPADDRLGAPRVAVVNETMARLYWPEGEAIGRCLLIGEGDPPCAEVVGVVKSARRQAVLEGDSVQYYVPRAQSIIDAGPSLFVRLSSGSERGLAGVTTQVRRAAFTLVPDLRYVTVQSFDFLIGRQLRAWRLGAILFTVLGGLSALVAGAGLYSVLSFEVAGRQRELGVRSALGASRSRLVRSVVGQGVRVALTGALSGLVVALALGSLVQSLLYETSARDPALLLLCAALLSAIAALASWWPARRAGAVAPARVLQAE